MRLIQIQTRKRGAYQHVFTHFVWMFISTLINFTWPGYFCVSEEDRWRFDLVICRSKGKHVKVSETSWEAQVVSEVYNNVYSGSFYDRMYPSHPQTSEATFRVIFTNKSPNPVLTGSACVFVCMQFITVTASYTQLKVYDNEQVVVDVVLQSLH